MSRDFYLFDDCLFSLNLLKYIKIVSTVLFRDINLVSEVGLMD